MTCENVFDQCFVNWNPKNYLQEYFLSDLDGEPAIQFIIDESSKLNGEAHLVDVGSGPTVCYWEAIAPKTASIVLSDYLDSNLQEQRKWVNYDADRFDWNFYTRMILQYEGVQFITNEDIANREAVARSKVVGYHHCDITAKDPLGIPHRNAYDCVTSLYCADSMTEDKGKWRCFMENIFSLLKPGGVFIGASMRNCTHYMVGEYHYPAANIHENDFFDLFNSYGFERSSIRIETACESQQISKVTGEKRILRGEYNEVVLASGRLSETLPQWRSTP